MVKRLSDFISRQALTTPEKEAMVYKSECLSYGSLNELVTQYSQGLLSSGIKKGDRVANYLPTRPETVVSIFGSAHAGGVFVPINPVLKPRQVGYILRDCNVSFFITSADRLLALKEELSGCLDLKLIILIGKIPEVVPTIGKKIISYDEFMALGQDCLKPSHDVIDTDIASILYTSGSTGMPKGVVLSHRNMIVGAESVVEYLENTFDDRILSIIPLSFDVGLNQLTTAFAVGATAVLMNYLLPRDVISQAAKNKITGITCVPPLWIQLADMEWPEETLSSIRYVATTGGRMPVPVTKKLRQKLPNTSVYLMYGLTESFRSTYLPPAEIDRIPESIGKAIPNAEIMVVREDGSKCSVGESGELVHRGPLVGLGYWNDRARTVERFKPLPWQSENLPITEIAVWSGDTVKKDKDGYLYFVGRKDEMIKTAGYRVSPTELEETIYASGLIGEICAMGIDDSKLGQVIWLVLSQKANGSGGEEKILAYCRKELPNYMVPQKVITWDTLPKNPNGKIDRKAIAAELKEALKNQEEN